MDTYGKELDYPEFLQQLQFETDNLDYNQFYENIRAHNSTMFFLLMGAKTIHLPGRAPYMFKIHGHNYHRSSYLQPHNDQDPQFAQLYVLDNRIQATKN